MTIHHRPFPQGKASDIRLSPRPTLGPNDAERTLPSFAEIFLKPDLSDSPYTEGRRIYEDVQRLRRLQTSPLTDTRPPPSAYPLSPNETHLGGSVHLPPLHGYVSRLGMCTSPDNNSTDESNPKHHGSPGSEVTVRGPRLEMHLTILGGPPPTQKTTNNRDSYSSNDSGFSASFASSTTSPTHPGTNRVSPKLPPINGIPESENRLPLDEFPESLTLAPMRGEPNLPAQLSGPAALLSPSRDVHEPKASYREVETHYRSPRTMAGRRTPRMPTMRCRINKQFDTGFRHPGHAYLPPSGHKVKRRGNLPKPVTEKLKAWFTDHIGHPYPSEDEKQILMAQTRLSLSQISNWFINARRRKLPKLNKEAEAEARLRHQQSEAGVLTVGPSGGMCAEGSEARFD